MQTKQANRATLIVGLGVTGLASARFLQRQKQPFALWHEGPLPVDLEQIKQEFPKAVILLGQLTAAQLGDYAQIILSPGVPRSHPMLQQAMQMGILIRSDIDLFVAHNRQPVLAITGSNGKTTVASLVAHLLGAQGLKVALGGNIGTPALALLEQDYDLAVLELSSFQLESTPNLNAQVACILNASPDHLDRYPSFGAYVDAKLNIMQGAQATVCNLDDAALLQVLSHTATSLSFSVQQTADFYIGKQAGQTWLYAANKPLVACAELALHGQHNRANALAALAMCAQAGYAPESLIESLKRFNGLPHRCEYLGQIQGVDVYNDSKGTNVGATIAAINSVSANTKGKLWLLAGGVAKEQDFSALAQTAQEKVAGVHLFGADAKQIAQALSSALSQEFATLDEAYQALLPQLNAGDAVLFSPACASFDQYANYLQRGDAFKQMVNIVRRQT